MKKQMLLGVLGAGLLAACETTPNPYPNGPGFYETQIETNRVHITYVVPPRSNRETAEDALLMRAADDTLEKGHSWFRVISRSRDTDRSQPSSSLSLGTGSTSFGRRSAVGFGFGTTVPLSGGPRSVLGMEIVMGDGARPNDVNAYDAKDVSKSLREKS